MNPTLNIVHNVRPGRYYEYRLIDLVLIRGVIGSAIECYYRQMTRILIQGAATASDVPGLDSVADRVDLVFAPDGESLARELPGCEILLGWNFRGKELEQQWHHAVDLRWIHWCGAGVDAVLFDGLRNSDVVLTNARGIFDHAMAEYVLGYMLAEVKDFRTTLRNQSERQWNYRTNGKLEGDRALVFGVGSIGREIARVLNKLGLKVSGVGRSERIHDPDFLKIFSSSDVGDALSDADWVIGILPSTSSTEQYFDGEFFEKMHSRARFINIGRGKAVVEADLLNALTSGSIAGAMLDVFENEPLENNDPLWDAPNLFISPHISGDYHGHTGDLVNLFTQNLDSYLAGKPLQNIVDKQLGFVSVANSQD
jgi:phosphoglycerate dehydrogenase-like enzyme